MREIDWAYLFTSAEGRIDRRQWWTGAVALFIAWLVAAILFGTNGLLAFVSGILLLVAGIMLHVKRCHDRGKSGWWCLLLFIPVVGFVWALVDLGLLEGTPGANAFGPPPGRSLTSGSA